MRFGALRWLLAIGLLAAFGWFFATRLDPAALARALGGADYRLVLLCAMGHMVVLHPVKAWRWALMLAPMQRISPWTLYHYNLAGCATTNVLPARSGQAVRVLLVRRHGVPLDQQHEAGRGLGEQQGHVNGNPILVKIERRE